MREPIYIGDGESTEFMDVLPDKLTLRPPLPEFYKDRWSRPDFTLFEEVNIKPYEHTGELLQFLEQEPWVRNQTYETVFEYLKNAIHKVWDSDKFHLIGHSSGYDSRLICKAIRELTEENGDKWAGEVLYVENMGEKPFKEIMEQKRSWSILDWNILHIITIKNRDGIMVRHFGLMISTKNTTVCLHSRLTSGTMLSWNYIIMMTAYQKTTSKDLQVTERERL